MSTLPHITPPSDGLPMPHRLWAILAVAAGVGASMALFRYLTGGGAAW